jgi:hypothetical protein
MRVFVSLLVLVGLHNTFPSVKRCVTEPNEFLGYPKKGIACFFSPYGHEQYLCNSLDQNNSAHDVTV